MYLIIFDGDLIHDNLIVMAKFEGNDIENFKQLLRSREVLSILRRSEFIDFWYDLVTDLFFEFDFEFINDEITDKSFEKIFSELNEQKINIAPYLISNYDKKRSNCFAIIEDDILLDIIRKCTNLLIEFDYPTFYF